MKRLVLLPAMLVSLSLFAAGCGGGSDKARMPTKEESDAFVKQRTEEMKNIKGVNGKPLIGAARGAEVGSMRRSGVQGHQTSISSRELPRVPPSG